VIISQIDLCFGQCLTWHSLNEPESIEIEWIFPGKTKAYRRQYHSRWQREQRFVAGSPQIAHFGDSLMTLSRISKFIVFAQLNQTEFNTIENGRR